jgi:hypothetical protein
MDIKQNVERLRTHSETTTSNLYEEGFAHWREGMMLREGAV